MSAWKTVMPVLCASVITACVGGGAAPAAGLAASGGDGSASAALGGAALTQAAAAETSAAQPAAQEEDSANELICERVQETGTHRRVRRCYTRAQRDQAREESQEFMRENGRARSSPGPAN